MLPPGYFSYKVLHKVLPYNKTNTLSHSLFQSSRSSDKNKGNSLMQDNQILNSMLNLPLHKYYLYTIISKDQAVLMYLRVHQSFSDMTKQTFSLPPVWFMLKDDIRPYLHMKIVSTLIPSHVIPPY